MFLHAVSQTRLMAEKTLPMGALVLDNDAPYQRELIAMASKSFAVTNYSLNVGFKNTAGWGGVTIQIQGYVACFGADGARFIVYGLHPSSPVPPSPVYNVAGNVGAIFVPFSDLHHYVDIVRNEKPVYARLDSDHPTWMSLSTSQEPVGEEEGV